MQSALYATHVAWDERVHTPLGSAIASRVLTCNGHGNIMDLYCIFSKVELIIIPDGTFVFFSGSL